MTRYGLYTLGSLFTYTWIQGISMRKNYKPCAYVPGPNVGVVDEKGDVVSRKSCEIINPHLLSSADFILNDKDTRRLVVIGDSMVMGIGMEPEILKADGPALSQNLASQLASSFGRKYEYQSVGYNGADLIIMNDNVIPELKRLFSNATKPNELVCMCGLNDAKDVLTFQSNLLQFQAKFRQLLIDIRAIVGPDCHIVVPSYPVNLCVAFDIFPVKYAIQGGMRAWDHQKRVVIEQLAQEGIDSNISYVEKVEVPADWKEKTKDVSLQGEDGIHPNTIGYKLFAIVLSRHIQNTYKKNNILTLKNLETSPQHRYL
eukprot:GDKJ01060332.1.p1 GENE.GDKJ01060332.1~~GDKJ01060332.1.p1  ORF type:complete len:315 (+),score=41.01 GDKJ01060332.1:126-1070(+)